MTTELKNAAVKFNALAARDDLMAKSAFIAQKVKGETAGLAKELEIVCFVYSLDQLKVTKVSTGAAPLVTAGPMKKATAQNNAAKGNNKADDRQKPKGKSKPTPKVKPPAMPARAAPKSPAKVPPTPIVKRASAAAPAVAPPRREQPMQTPKKIAAVAPGRNEKSPAKPKKPLIFAASRPVAASKKRKSSGDPEGAVRQSKRRLTAKTDDDFAYF